MCERRPDSGWIHRLALGWLLLVGPPGAAAGAVVTLHGVLPGLWSSSLGDAFGLGLFGLVSASSAAGGYLAGVDLPEKAGRIGTAFAGLVFGDVMFLLTMTTLWANLFGT